MASLMSLMFRVATDGLDDRDIQKAWVTDVRGDHDKLDICKVENLRDDQISFIAVTTVVVTIL
jgi:hypothetical protein